MESLTAGKQKESLTACKQTESLTDKHTAIPKVRETYIPQIEKQTERHSKSNISIKRPSHRQVGKQADRQATYCKETYF